MKIFISIFFVLIIGILTSNVKVNIINFEKKKESFELRFNINVGLYLFGFLKIFSINFNEIGIKFCFFRISYNKIKFKKNILKDVEEISMIYIIKALKIYLKKFNFIMEVGCEVVQVSIFITSIVSIFFSYMMGRNSKQINGEKVFYKIYSNYNSNFLVINFSSILSIKTINIIKLICSYLKKHRKNTSLKEAPLKI